MQTNNGALPTELFFQIFHHLDVADGPLGLRGALFVCRLWNAIILHDTHLWTNLVFNRMFLEQLAPNPTKLLNYMERCGALSGDHFIRMSVDIAAVHDHLHPDGTRTQQSDQQRLVSASFFLLTIARAMARAGTFRGRIRTLVFSGGHGSSSGLRVITSVMIDLVKEHLQHLELHRCRDNPIGSTVSLPRSLETVFLLDPNWEPYSYAPSGLIPARQLTFQRMSSWCGDDLAHISLYQSLTELCLISSPTGIGEPDSIFAAFDSLNIGSTKHTVLLPYVTTLYITGAIPFRILDPLNLPALTTIEVRNHDFRHPLSTVHLTTLHHAITRLVVLFSPETADEWGGALAAVLAGASQLRTLITPRWMELHLSVSDGVDIELI